MRPGDHAPGFSLPDQRGVPCSLAQWLERGPVVLFFYPAAMSPGCTREASHFRDLAAEFAARGATCVGVSPDAPARQGEFDRRCDLGYPLLADEDGRVAALYGARRRMALARTRRLTFVIARDARVVEVIASELSMRAHAERALVALDSLADQ